MANSVHTSQSRKVRSNSQKNKEENISIISASYVSDFSIAITFSSDVIRIVNFLPLFEKYVKGDNLKFFAPERFKKFIAKNGNIYWGKNEDVIFPIEILYNDDATKVDADKILYII